MTDRKEGSLAPTKPHCGEERQLESAAVKGRERRSDSPPCDKYDRMAQGMETITGDGQELSFPPPTEVTRSMSSSSGEVQRRVVEECVTKNQDEHAVEFRKIDVAKVALTTRLDLPSNEDGCDVKEQRVTPEDRPVKERDSANSTGGRLHALHQRLQEARDASNSRTVTPEHYKQVDEAINGAILHLPLVYPGDSSSPLRWREPNQAPEAVDNMVPHDMVERLRGLLEGHKGSLESLMLNPIKATKLRAIFPGVEDVEIYRLLNETQTCMEVGAN